MMKINKRYLIGLCGPSASGKSTLSRHLSDYFDTHTDMTSTVISSDTYRMTYPVEEHMARYPDHDINDYRAVIRRMVIDGFNDAHKTTDVIIADSGHIYQHYRDDLENNTKKMNRNFVGLFLDVSHDTCLHRLRHRQNDISKATNETLARQFIEGEFELSSAWHTLDAEQDADHVCHQARIVLKSYGL